MILFNLADKDLDSKIFFFFSEKQSVAGHVSMPSKKDEFFVFFLEKKKIRKREKKKIKAAFIPLEKLTYCPY